VLILALKLNLSIDLAQAQVVLLSVTRHVFPFCQAFNRFGPGASGAFVCYTPRFPLLSNSPLPPSLPPSGSHTDLAKGTAPHYKGAVKHYASLAERAVSASHVIDIFACSLDQVCVSSLPPSLPSSLLS